MVGGRCREPPPQYCRPGEPAIANHLSRHEVHHQVSRRRVASDARNRRPRTSKQEGSIPKSDLWITAGSGVGALFFFELDPTETERYKGQDRGATDTDPKATRPRPKATATSRRPEPHPENTVQKEGGGPTVKQIS